LIKLKLASKDKPHFVLYRCTWFQKLRSSTDRSCAVPRTHNTFWWQKLCCCRASQ